MIVGDRGCIWIWVIVHHFLGDCGWLDGCWMIVGDCGWLWVISWVVVGDCG